MKVVIGQFTQETNSFSPIRAGIEKFNTSPATKGIGVISSVLAENGIEAIPSVSLAAFTSGGKVKRDVVKKAVLDITQAIEKNSPVDGVFLFLHGATQAEGGIDDVVGHILKAARAAAGASAVIGAAFDFHANVTEEVMKNADVVTGFRTYPHIDIMETVERMARIGSDMLCGRKTPHMRMIKLPMFHQAEACLTTSGPMKTLMELAEPKNFDGVYDISVFQVQPWLDAPEAGASVVVVADTQEHADVAADKLAHHYWSIKNRLKYKLHELDSVIDMALAKPGRPVIVSDSADAPPAGSPGDSAAILIRLIERDLCEKLTCYMTINCPAAMRLAFRTGVGNSAEFTLGGAYDKLRQKQVKVRATVKLLHDGKYVIDNDNYRGVKMDIGKTAVLQIGQVLIIVADCQINSVFDDLYRSFGMLPEKADIIVAKSAMGYRSYYRKYTDLMFTVDTPGSSSSNLFQFDFKKLTRPVYPFDKVKEYKPISNVTGHMRG